MGAKHKSELQLQQVIIWLANHGPHLSPSASWPSALPLAFAATGLQVSSRRLLVTSWVRKRGIKYVLG